MKRTLSIIIIFFALVASAYSQITIIDSDIASIGAVFSQRTDTMPTVVPGGSGASQTWDMTGLSSDRTKQINVVAPLSLPFGNRFIGANIGMTENDTVTNYFFNKNTSCVNTVGFTMDLAGNGDTLCVIFTDQDTMLTFPSTYNTSFINYINGNTKSRSHLTIDTVILGNPYTVPVDSVRIVHHAVKSSLIDGWGTLNMPNGNVNALRQKTHETSIDSIFAHINFPPFIVAWYYYMNVKDTMDQFIYWTKWAGNAIVKLDYDSATATVTNADWLFVTNLGIQPNVNNADILLYPNPANEIVTIETKPIYDYIRIFDITGKEVYTSGLVHGENINISTTGLTDGIYFMKLTGMNVPPTTRKFIVQH
jgi:hypothetical protein